VSDEQALVKYEQLDETEQSIMWRIWEHVVDGLHISDVDKSEDQALINLYNFHLIYQSMTRRLHYSATGRAMMIGRKLADREQSA
jgi:hypothetical protein